jgi:hypothetical protein
MNENQTYDYAIVGGGIAGAYSAWRILQDAHDRKRPPPSVILLEQNNRIGGRLLSLEPPGIPTTRVEIGGMRYSDAHRWVCSLTEYLDLKKQALPADRPENIAYLRGVHLRYQDSTNAELIPYTLMPDERSPAALASLTMFSAQKAIQEITGDPNAQPTPEEWEKVRYTGTFHGAHLQDISMRYVILNTVSHEAFAMQEGIGGYDSVLHTWNAIDGFPWNLGDFAHPVDFHHTIAGYDQIPIILSKNAIGLGAKVYCNTKVTQIQHDEGTKTFTIDLTGDAAPDAAITAKCVIMAAPLRSIEILNHNYLFWEPGSKAEDLFKSVTPIPLYKLALCYSSAWWKKLPPVEVDIDGKKEMRRITTGKSNTDLPVRQCYYWWTDQNTDRSVIMIYDDGVDLEYWAGMRDNADARYPYDPTQAGGAAETAQWAEHSAPKLMAEEVHRQLLELHGLTDDTTIPAPYAATYMDWGQDPYGGGANFWHVGVDSIKAATDVVKPNAMELYVCGECWSHDQGWVEGALVTAEDMLQNHLDLPQPKWFKPNLPT